MGFLYFRKPPQEPLMRPEGQSLRPPIFLEHFLSGSDNGRDRLIKTRSRPGSAGDYPRLQRETSPFSRCACSDPRSGL